MTNRILTPAAVEDPEEVVEELLPLACWEGSLEPKTKIGARREGRPKVHQYEYSTIKSEPSTFAGGVPQVLREKASCPPERKNIKQETSEPSKACGRTYKAPRRTGRKSPTRVKRAPPVKRGTGRTELIVRAVRANPSSSLHRQ